MPRMKSGAFVSTYTCVLLATLALAACGNDGGSGADAPPLVPVVDAMPPPPDAFVCTQTMCGMDCVDTTTDEFNCGMCGRMCQSGASCTMSDCVCPPSFLPAVLDQGFMEQVTDQFPGAYVALYPFFEGIVNLAAVGYPMVGTQIGMDYTLTDQLGTPPFVAAGYNLDIQTQTAQAAFYATSGTLNFTTACNVGATGTLTNATFQAVESITNPVIDPNGCTFTVDMLTFDIGAPCP
jgi:hypothetical protein